jgi:hypothetical protein
MERAQGCLLGGIDLGTSATTAQLLLVRDSYDAEGKLHRESLGSAVEMKSWQGARRDDPIGNICLPTDMVYDRTSKNLLCMGFQAQEYMDDPKPEPPRTRVFIVEHIKLLLMDPKKTAVSPQTAARYNRMRDELKRVLDKSPDDIFQDFLDKVVGEIIRAAKAWFRISLATYKFELALAFPSGWQDVVHRRVTAIAARSVKKALELHGLETMAFGIQDVYTLSETECGAKQWLAAAINDEALELDLSPKALNLDELTVSYEFTVYWIHVTNVWIGR